MNNKKRINTYKTIYPVLIVIANKHVTYEDLNKDYMNLKEEDLSKSITDEGSTMTTSTVYRRKDHKFCILIKQIENETLESLIDDCCHEAMHAVLDTWNYIDDEICLLHQEPPAYLCGFVGKCIFETCYDERN